MPDRANIGCKSELARIHDDLECRELCSLTVDGGAQSCTISSNVPTTPMFLIMNVAVGGFGGGTVNNSTLPQTMYIDYVKVNSVNQFLCVKQTMCDVTPATANSRRD